MTELTYETKQTTQKEKKEKKKKSPLSGRSFRFTSNMFVILMLAIPIIHFCVFSLGVHINTVLLTFQKRDDMLNKYVFLEHPFENYKMIFQTFKTQGSGLPYAVRNSFILFALNDFFLIPASLILTYFLYKKMPMEGFFRVVFYLPSIISVVVLIMVYRFMFDSTIGVVDPMLMKLGLGKLIPKFGWLGTESTAMKMVVGYCIWAGLGGNIVILSGAMARCPIEVMESAKLDGVGFWGELFKIIVPLIGPTMGTILLLGVQVIFTYFMPVMLLTNGGPNETTLTIPLYTMKLMLGDTGDLSGSATLGLIITFVGTPMIIGARTLLDKLFPSYEF